MIARTRRSLALAALMSTATLLATPAAHAQDLERRMDNLERKFDALLDLMQQQLPTRSPPVSPAGSSGGAASTKPVAVPESIRMGQLYLDLYTLPLSKTDAARAAFNASAIPADPNGVAVGSMIVEPAGQFKYGEFVADPALATFARANAMVQTVWNGLLKIDESGVHAFQLSVGKEAGPSGARTCRASLNIEGKPITTVFVSNAQDLNQVYSTEQGSISLQPGFYAFSLYVACIRFPGMDVFERYGATLLMAAPGDRVAKPIPAHLFGIRE